MTTSATPRYLSPREDSPLYRLWPAESWPRLIVLATLLLIPLIFMPDVKRHYEFPKSWAFRFMALLAVMTWWAARSRVKSFRNPFSLPMAVWIMGAGLSVLAAANMAESLDALYIIDILLAYFFIYVAINTLYTVRHLRQALYVMLFAGIAISIYGVLQVWGMDPWGLVPKGAAPVSFLGNQNYASYIHDMVLPLAAGYTAYLIHNAFFPVPPPASHPESVAQRPPTPGKRQTFRQSSLIERVSPFSFIVVGFYFLVGPYHMLACDCNGNKVGMMLTAYGTFCVIALFVVLPHYFQMRELPEEEQKAVIRKRSLYQRLGVAGSVLFFVFGSLVFGMNSDYVKTLVTKKSGIFRRDVWVGSLQKTQDNVFLGIGPGNFKVIHPLYESPRERFVLGTEVLGRKAHSDYLEKVVEGGFFAAIGVFWMMAVTVWLLWTCINGVMQLRDRLDLGRAPPEKVYNLELFYRFALWLTIGLIGALICIGFHANLEAPLLQPGSMVMFVMLLAMLVTLHRLIRRSLLVGSEPPTVTVTRNRPRTWIGRFFPLWDEPMVRWALVPLVVLLLYTPTMRHFLGEAFLRQGMGEHEMAEGLKNEARRFMAQAQAAQQSGQRQQATQLQQQALYYQEASEEWNEKMFASFDKSLRLYPHYMETYYILGRYCIDTGEYQRGVEVLRRDIMMNPNYKWAHNNIGVCYDRLDDVHNARIHYYAALEVDPHQIYALFNLAIGYLRTDNPKAAIVKFTETLAVDPTKVEAYKFRAMAWDQLCQELTDAADQKRCREMMYDDVAAYLERANVEPEDAGLIRQYVNFLMAEDRLEEAAPLVQRMPEFFANNTQMMRQMARLYVNQGQYADAERVLEELTKKLPRDGEVWYNLALVRASQGMARSADVLDALREAFLYDAGLIDRAREEQVLQNFLSRPEFQRILEALQ